MNTKITKRTRYLRRKDRIRAKLSGTAACPRLVVSRSLKHISCQLIDDTVGKVLAATSDSALKAVGKPMERATVVGTAIAKLAIERKITTVVFDRSGRRYHGRVKAVAEAARTGGLQF